MKAIVNALTLALAEEGLVGPESAFESFTDAREFAERFFAENAELLQAGPPSPVAPPAARPATPAEVARVLPAEPTGVSDSEAVRPARRAPARPGDIMPQQAAAIERGIPLCPNCQQPQTDHLPGCARAPVGGLPPMDPRAVTKSPLPPAVG